MNLIKTIKNILSEAVKKSQLPKKPENHLFSKKILSKLETSGDEVTLYHYGPSKLKVLDPKYFGEHSYSMSESWWGKKRIFFYTKKKQVERFVGGLDSSLYVVKYKLSDLYPFNEDPLNLYDFAAKEWGSNDVPVRWQVIHISDFAQKIGYKGMVYLWENGGYLAVIWEKVPVSES